MSHQVLLEVGRANCLFSTKKAGQKFVTSLFVFSSVFSRMDVISPLTRLRSGDRIINTDPFHGLGENRFIKAATTL